MLRPDDLTTGSTDPVLTNIFDELVLGDEEKPGRILLKKKGSTGVKIQGGPRDRRDGEILGSALGGASGFIELTSTGFDGKVASQANLNSNFITISNDDEEVVKIDGINANLHVGASGNEGDIYVRDDKGRVTFRLWGKGANLYIGASGNEGDIYVRDEKGREVFHVNGRNANLRIGKEGNSGDIKVQNKDGDETIRLDGSSGDIILRNADCAEDFDILSVDRVTPGTVMVINDDGALQSSEKAYDKRVAGVISGAGGYKPGLVLDRRDDESNRLPVALMGKVFCKVDASFGEIEVGDLLTTSPIKGFAMKASDSSKAFGSVIGKALKSLQTGQDLIPILVALQ